jgi:Family of unknown function (DUF6184)
MTTATKTATAVNLRRRVIFTLVATIAAVTGRGCGGVADTRVEARDSATQHTCTRYQACGDLGAGMSYPDFSACTTYWQASWDSQWPVADCQGRIDQGQLAVCLSAIDGTSCTSVLDFLNTMYVKCGKANVCDFVAPADGAAD